MTVGYTGNLKSCFYSLRGQTREKQRRCLPADGEKPHTSSPRQSGGPAALPRAEHHRSHAQQSKRLHHASLCSNKWELFAGNQLASDSEDLTFFIVLLLRNCYEMNGFGVFETAAALSE